MTIIYKESFENQLLQIVDYIAKDKVSASIKFANELEKLIFSIPNNPYKYRQSIYFSDNKYLPIIYHIF